MSIFRRLWNVVRRSRLDDEIRKEFDSHLALLEDEERARGLSVHEARQRARFRFGNSLAHRERAMDAVIATWLDTIRQDIGFACRQLGRRPGFSTIAMLTMALGIGVNVTAFTALNAVTLRLLPIRNAARAVRVERWFESGSRGNGQYFFSYPEYRYLRDSAGVFEQLVAASASSRVAISGASSADSSSSSLVGQFVSDNFFASLGVDAAAGRTFTADEARMPGGQPAIVLSDAFWQRRFHRDRAIVGSSMGLFGTTMTIVGVMPATFVGLANPPETPDFWAPLGMGPRLSRGPDSAGESVIPDVQVVGFLRPGTSLAAGGARLVVLARAWNDAFRSADKTTALTIAPATYFGGTNDPRFAVTIGAIMTVVGLILLTACANLANMLLARGSARQREIGVRIALGASRGRIARQLLTESLLLSAGGAVVAVLGSTVLVHLLWVRLEETVRLFAGGADHFDVDLSPDLHVFGYTVAIAVLASLVFGLWPALRASRADISSGMKNGSAQSTEYDRSRLRGFILGAQAAVSMTLLITAGLLTRGILRSASATPGFDVAHVYFLGAPSRLGPLEGPLAQTEILARLARSPDLRAALVDRVPLTGTWSPRVQLTDGTAIQGAVPRATLANRVSSDFVKTLGLDVVRGRNFSSHETTRGAPVALISANGARAFWPGGDPIGRRISLDLAFNDMFQTFTIIGVVSDVRSANLSRVDPSFVYLPTDGSHIYNLLVQSDRDPSTVRSAIGGALGASSPTSVETFESLDRFARVQRILPETLAAFARWLSVIALFLTAVGIHGVISFLVSRRVREIGVRVALGATTWDIVALVLRQGLRPVAVGIVVGLGVSAALSAFLTATLSSPAAPDFLFGIGAFDPATFGGLTVFLLMVAGLASAMPARLVAKVDPVVALRLS